MAAAHSSPSRRWRLVQSGQYNPADSLFRRGPSACNTSAYSPDLLPLRRRLTRAPKMESSTTNLIVLDRQRASDAVLGGRIAGFFNPPAGERDLMIEEDPF